jgi:hypothetical protein
MQKLVYTYELFFFFHLRFMISILSDLISLLAYLNLFEIKDFIVVVVLLCMVVHMIKCVRQMIIYCAEIATYV